MQRSKIEFRICYGSIGAVEAERVALALVHWDGRQLRAATRDRVPPGFDDARAPLERMLHSLQRLCDRAPETLNLGLDAAFPVREGYAAGAWWSPLRVGHTSNPERHFRELAESLRLAGERARAAPDITRPKLNSELATVRDRVLALHAGATDRVLVDHRVNGPTRAYDSPLSWRTRGVWSHTLSIIPALRTATDPVSEVLAVRQLHVPAEDALVVVYPAVGEPAILEELERDLTFVSNRPGARLRSLSLPFVSGKVDVAGVERLVLDDLAA